MDGGKDFFHRKSIFPQQILDPEKADAIMQATIPDESLAGAPVVELVDTPDSKSGSF